MSLYNSEVAEQQFENNKKVRRIQVQKQSNKAPKTRDWLPEEDQVLKKCIAKYGVGRYSPITQYAHLPFRSAAQLSARTKKLIGMGALQTFTGIHLDVDRVARDNRRRYKTDYVVNKSGVRKPESQIEQEWEHNERKYGLSAGEIKRTVIPYFRRPDDPQHIALKQNEKVKKLTAKENHILEAFNKELEAEAKTEKLFKTFFIPKLQWILEKHPDWNYKQFKRPANLTISLGTFRAMGVTSLVMVDTHEKRNLWDMTEKLTPIEKVQPTKGPSPAAGQIRVEHFFIQMSRRNENGLVEVVIAKRENTNLWNLTSNVHGRTPLWIYTTPKGAIPRNMTIDPQSMKSLAGKNNKWKVVLADPPWRIAGKNPTRGVALSYPTQSANKIMNLPWKSLQQGLKEQGYLFVWVTSATYLRTITEITRAGYHLREEIVWIKYSKRSKIHLMPGPWTLRGKESCLVFTTTPNSDTDSLTTTPCSDVLACLRRDLSQKPDELYELIESLVPNESYLELYARNHNLRSGWTSIGNQISTELIVSSNTQNP